MKASFSFDVKNVSNNTNISHQRSYATPVSFCGVDVFERGAVQFSKELCVEAANQLFKAKTTSEVSNAFDKISLINKIDPQLDKLDKLSNKYKKTLSLDDKKILLKHEENMHWEELETPEVGVVRNFFDMYEAGINEKFIPAMQISTLNGLGRIAEAYSVFGLRLPPDQAHFNLLKKLVEHTPDSSTFAHDIKSQALACAGDVATNDEDFTKLASYIKKNTNDKELKLYANSMIDCSIEYNEAELLNKLSGNGLQDYEKISVIQTLVTEKSEKLAEGLPAMIQDPKASHKVKISAVWAAGKCKSSENFDLLYKMANNNDVKKLEEREMALHSISLYLRTNEAQVKSTLNNVIKEKSDLSELATILLEKSEGRYYTKDKELAHLSEEEKTLYKAMRDKYVETDFKPNIQQANIIDRALILFKNSIATIAGKNTRLYVADETCTRYLKDSVGVRLFAADPVYAGYFYDSMTGFATPKKVFVNKSDLKDVTKYNVLAHEFNHSFLNHCLSPGEDQKKLRSLYKTAVKRDKCLDDYAQLTPNEYFAQGYEAYCSVYKPHDTLLGNNDFANGNCHLRSTLKRKDPDLYDFIEHCIKKYNS